MAGTRPAMTERERPWPPDPSPNSSYPEPAEPEPKSVVEPSLRQSALRGAFMSQSLTERYEARIAGVLSCYDRVMITGTLRRSATSHTQFCCMGVGMDTWRMSAFDALIVSTIMSTSASS